MVSRDKRKKHKNKTMIERFLIAFCGIKEAFKREKTLRIAGIITIVVILFSIIFKLSTSEWIICILLCGLVMALEMINTAIELAVDIAMPNIHPLAKLSKDIAAGAVVISVVTAGIIAAIIFIPKIIGLF